MSNDIGIQGRPVKPNLVHNSSSLALRKATEGTIGMFILLVSMVVDLIGLVIAN